MSMQFTPANVSVPHDGAHQRACFERVQATIRALPRAEWLTPTVDPVYAASVALRAAPRFMALRPRMEALAGELDLALIDAVPDLAHALSYACGDYVTLTERGEPLAELVREGVALRDLLFSVKELCERAGVVQGTSLAQGPRLTGSRNVSRDLTALKRFFDESEAALAGKTPVTPAQLDRAGYLAARLLAADVDEAAGAGELSEAEQLRVQAFSAFMRAYDEVRAAVALLRRREGDADEIAPSVYAGRARPKRREPEAPAKGGAEGAQPGAAEASTDGRAPTA